MKSFTILPVVLIMFFSGCEVKETRIITPEADAASLKQLVLLAINGSKIANDSLSGLIDQNAPTQAYNELRVENLNGPADKKFLSVLVEYPNPVYNRFAVYDHALNPLLFDKSLNGWLKMEPVTVDSVNFIKIMESFNSKDVLEFERLSLYRIGPDSVNLCLRIFTKFEEPASVNTQTIRKLNSDTIITQINTPGFRRNISDAFYYDEASGEYKSRSDLFKQFVLNQLKTFGDSVQNPQLK
jgi:hypothetical protein